MTAAGMATVVNKKTNSHPPNQNDITSPYLPASRASTLGIWTPLRRAQPSQSSLRRAHTVTQSGIAKRTDRPLANRTKKDQSSALLRTKASTEVMHHRTTTHDGWPSGREGKHFTVANVGNNGKLYLRPLVESNSRRHHGQPVNFSPPSLHRSKLLPSKPSSGPDARHSIWSSSQLSELRPKYPLGESVEVDSDVDDQEPRQRRAYSFSTISEYEPSAPTKDGQELRIVIDRFDSHESNKVPSVAALQVPIPHYRLGTPQFNAEGSPVLRSSLYTHTSLSDNVQSSIFLKDNVGENRIPSTYDSPGLVPPAGGTLSVAMSLFSGVTTTPGRPRFSNSTQRSAIYNLRHPIEPAVFDFLTKDMSDPSVVKYMADSRDISAATPARIVAEISSDSFMDYELVSDFFLTFRSYLSTTNLLALLLARLEWAINRLQDDGRIIRIRTFAALRHWILNYFADDFVSNRDLRVQFCDKINSMYTHVKARPTAGISDIKILVDLKRCWHGRCLLHWDCPPFVGPDTPVIPGGVPGSRDLNKTRLSEVSTPYPEAVIDPEMGLLLTGQLVTNAQDIRSEHNTPQKMHMRNVSSGTSRSLPSSNSDHSVQAVSCSFPGRRVSVSVESVNTPHPIVVPTQSAISSSNPRSPTASSTRRPAVHAHKRSGSFSDSIRDDRAPLSQAVTEGQGQALLSRNGSGSLIRGNLLPPGEASVGMRAPPSPTLPHPSDALLESHTRSASEGNIRPLGASPGLRTVIGSIRRALHSKGISSTATSGPANSRFPRGKTAALPVNLAFRSDLYKDRRVLPVHKYPPRVDFFCQQSMKEYREALGLDAPHPSLPLAKTESSKSGGEGFQLQASNLPRQRLASEVTMGSKSIVIVDDTGPDLPVVSGGLGWLGEQTENGQSKRSSTTQKNDSSSHLDEVSVPVSAEIYKNDQVLAPQSINSPVQRFLDTPSVRRTDSIASRLRKYASFHSGTSHSLQEAGSENSSSEVSGEKPFARLLRRRPGGNLRNIQNIHDLEPHMRPQSFATDTSLTESVASSARHYFRRTFSRSSQARALSTPPRFDLINTHSSQNLRPSFEAAIAEFSRIPDDTDGGIESTLLKLEGKWPLPTSSGSRSGGERVQRPIEVQDYSEQGFSTVPFRGTGHNNKLSQTTVGKATVTETHRYLGSQLYSESVMSEFSDSSIPLLERGLSDDSMKKPSPTSHPFDTPRPHTGEESEETTKCESPHPSFQIIDDTESLRQISQGLDMPGRPSTEDHTEEYHSDLSSEVSVDVIDKNEAAHSSNSTGYSLPAPSIDIPSHPLAHPPSPPMTIQQTTSGPPYPKPETPVASQAPLTPGPSPTRRAETTRTAAALNETRNSDSGRIGLSIRVPQAPNHVPFILAYNSQVLAQQLTVVEKSALDEIDWKDLVEMKWNHNSSTALNWVQFLAEQERKGIDLVVGRFNLMVKWILSEIVLTRDIAERAQTISKYIHIAAHARRMCNYSTMLQIAIALSSVDCTRLQNTWALVSPADKHLLEDMEALIQPVRNFHELRVEMETANLQDGCIPFVGLYVHDLTYNAQKPSQIVGTREGDALVNFERYRTAARIVKCLLRLIDASDKYNLEPVPGIVEKCLWVASLPEEQIQALSKSLE